MGVRGLTSFIARHAELYLTPYELHDCNLVIDGDNLACNLYKDVTGTYSAFGGDYDDFYRAVVNFFHVLAECNIESYVLMDGGYEKRKLRTVNKRLRGKIAVIKRINPCGSITVFPLMMKEVFVDAVRASGVPVMRCVFEADDELAALSRKLNCPVLSYDSDFYIHNVRYIPLVTLTVKAHTKRLRKEDEDVDSNVIDTQRRLRKNEARHLEKQTKSNRIMGTIQLNNVERRGATTRVKTYKYLDCCMYRIENLIARGSLNKSKLPLFAALLGNDYIARSSFKNFFAAGLGKGGRSRKMKQQQRRINVIMQWLKHETSESALEKILIRLRKEQRESLLAQVNAATSGYSNELCHSYDFFVANYENAFDKYINQLEDDDDEYVDQTDDEESENEEDIEQQTENEESEEDLVPTSEEESNDSKHAVDEKNDINEDNDDEFEENDDEVDGDDEADKTQQFPAWFLDKLYPAKLPRFMVDLVHLKKYINNPQIEHYPYNECHEIAIPILVYNFTLLNSVNGEELQPILSDDGTELPIELTYLTRATRVTNIRYHQFPMQEQSLKYDFHPRAPNPLHFCSLFENTKMPNVDTDALFKNQLNKLPADLQLYFLAIVYWLQKSQHCDLLHMHALVICLVVLRTIDSKIPAERDMKAFQKRFGKIIKKERLVREQELSPDQNGGVAKQRSMKPDLLNLPIPERMPYIPKSDCYLVQDNLLKHFHMQEIFKKKYDLFSTTVLHAFAEFQSVVFQLYSLNGLLDCPYESTQMAHLYCGVFLYNIYDLLRSRLDLRYYVEHFIFRDSPMMFDLYVYLIDWCEQYVPHWKQQQQQATSSQAVNKKVMKKQRQEARKKASKEQELANADPNADMVDHSSENCADETEEFFDINNKFCTFLKIR